MFGGAEKRQKSGRTDAAEFIDREYEEEKTMRIKETKVYPFGELSDEAKETALEKLSDINTVYDWWDSVYDDAKEIGKLMGIDIDNIYFSGFSSQGDGACFEGSYEYRKNSVKAVMEYAPKDEELHQIVKDLQTMQRKYFYQLFANIKHSGHYQHKYCTVIDVGHNDCYSYRLPAEADDDLPELLRDFMDWIYSQLRKNYEYLSSEKAIIEAIEVNEYEFTEDGKLA